MDINAHLQKTIELAAGVIATSEEERAIRLADHVHEMHHFLMNGGSYPAAWISHPRENLSRDQGTSGL